MQKTVFYLVTRNIYLSVIPSLKSLLKNGNVDRVYILAEDDDIGVDLPAKVIVKDITEWKQRLLDADGPNFGCRWSYMVMMKCAICYMFPKLDRALTMDVDTIVHDDLSPLWDLPMNGVYFYGAREPYWTMRYGRDYVNAGVLMWNLKRMRKDGMAGKVLDRMNRHRYTFVEQDCLNEMCRGNIGVFDAAYNAGDWTATPTEPIRIRHYMATRGQWLFDPDVTKYGRMDWDEVFRK